MRRRIVYRICGSILTVVCVSTAACRQSTEGTVHFTAAAVYGTVTSTGGGSVVGTQLRAFGYRDGCSGDTFAEGQGRVMNADGRYRIRMMAPVARRKMCVVVFRDGEEPPVSGPTVKFRAEMPEGQEDSVRVDITIP